MARAGRVAALVAAVVVAAAGAAEAKCTRGDYRVVPSRNDTATVEMQASSGMDCVIRIATTRRFTVTGRRIVENPANGKVSLEGETAFYRSLPGFKGQDRFVAELTARGTDGEGTSRIIVNVTVD
ncbi:hypothetical protein [Alsobacter sp. R-9]